MPKRSPAKIDYRDCEKRGRRCLLISQQCRWRFGKISLSVFRYDTSSDSAIGKQLKLPVRSILNQSQLNHVWDQYGRCLYACTIDDKLVVKRDSVVFVEVRSRYTFTTSDSQQLSGNVCKSGPLHFGSEKSFPSNFAQETILGHK